MTNKTITPPISTARRRPLPAALLAVFMGLAACCGARADEPRPDAVPGGIALVQLRPSATEPTATYDGRQILVTGSAPLHWHAVVGIPLSAKPGRKYVQIESRGWHYSAPFDVHSKHYATEHITMKNKRMVNPTRADLRRIAKERDQIDGALSHWTPRPPDSLAFIVPLHGAVSSPFGLRRVFNGEPRQPHSGIDIAAPAGTPIVAPAAGKVIDVGDYFFTGNTVIVDHGEGLISLYCHMSVVKVIEGEDVSRGQILGEVGMTGRTTGPHTHWGVALNDTMVNPTLFFPSRTAFEEELKPPAAVGAND